MNAPDVGHRRNGSVDRRVVLLCGVLPALVVAGLVLYRPPAVSQLDNRVFDAVVRSVPAHPISGRVAVVDIDERSIAAVGQWPWRRDVIARLIARLRTLGAAVVAFDVVFAESDRYEALPPVGITAADAALADEMRQGRVVLGYAFSFDDEPGGSSSGCVLHALDSLVVAAHTGVPEPPVFRATRATCGLPVLAEAAGASGFLNAMPDADGVLRRVPLLIEHDGRHYPALALAAVTAATGERPIGIRTANLNSTSLAFADWTAPLDGRSNLLLRYRGAKRTFPYVPAADVLNGTAPVAALKGAIVFVGGTAPGIREIVSTPYDRLFPGVEIHATVADNLLRRDFLARAPDAQTVELAAVLALGLSIALLAVRVGLLWTSAAAVLMLLALWPTARWLLEQKGQYFSPLFAAGGLLASLSAATVACLIQERRRAKQATDEKEGARRLMVQSLLSLTDIRDADTASHSRRTQRYSRLLAERLRQHPQFRDYLTADRINLLSSLAPLHDIGKVGVPDQLLHKPGALTPDEYQEMKKHPTYGLSVITTAQRNAGAPDDPTLMMARDIVYTHHERWDGKGYPRGLEGPEIPIAGRVIAIVDAYDALTSGRCYRHALPHEQALQVLAGGSGSQFDPAVVDALLSVAPLFQDVAREAGSMGHREVALS
ncbi:MAG: CHASE2 domain-containing protein [Vicinamibacterales bacterium]